MEKPNPSIPFDINIFMAQDNAMSAVENLHNVAFNIAHGVDPEQCLGYAETRLAEALQRIARFRAKLAA